MLDMAYIGKLPAKAQKGWRRLQRFFALFHAFFDYPNLEETQLERLRLLFPAEEALPVWRIMGCPDKAEQEKLALKLALRECHAAKNRVNTSPSDFRKAHFHSWWALIPLFVREQRKALKESAQQHEWATTWEPEADIENYERGLPSPREFAAPFAEADDLEEAWAKWRKGLPPAEKEATESFLRALKQGYRPQGGRQDSLRAYWGQDYPRKIRAFHRALAKAPAKVKQQYRQAKEHLRQRPRLRGFARKFKSMLESALWEGENLIARLGHVYRLVQEDISPPQACVEQCKADLDRIVGVWEGDKRWRANLLHNLDGRLARLAQEPDPCVWAKGLKDFFVVGRAASWVARGFPNGSERR